MSYHPGLSAKQSSSPLLYFSYLLYFSKKKFNYYFGTINFMEMGEGGGGPEISKMLIRPKFCSKRYPDCDFFYTDNSLLSCEVYVE